MVHFIQNGKMPSKFHWDSWTWVFLPGFICFLNAKTEVFKDKLA